MMRFQGVWFSTVLLLCALSGWAGDYNVYVSAHTGGGGTGTSEAPFSTLVQARDGIRAARKAGKLKAGQAATVWIAPGNYRLDRTLELGAEDSGSAEAPTAYRAQTPGTVKITGGTVLAPELFKPVADKNVLARLDPAVAGKVLVCEIPAQCPAEPFRDAFDGPPAAPWLYVDSSPMPLARWPNVGATNDGWAVFRKVTDNGLPQADAKDPAQKKAHAGAFVFDDPRPARWNLKAGVWLMGYWTHDWSEEVIRIAAYDAEKKVISLAAPHHYGIKGKTWGAAGRRFFAENLLEELDAPGEWYLDRATRRLYFYPPVPLSHAEVVLATLTQPLVKLTGVRNVRFTGLRFEYGHSDGVVMNDVENVELAGCVVANCAGEGILIQGNGNAVRSSELFNLGKGGISVEGGNRRTLAPGKNLAVNNHIHHYGLFKRTYAAGIHVAGCGQVVRNNCIHDAPHNAILYGGNEHLFELNEIYRVLLETGDAGAFYTGRDWTSQGNILRHNFIHDLGAGSGSFVNTMGVYLDDCDCGDTVQGNIFLRSGRAIMVGGGRDNPVLNNLVVDCPVGVHIDSRGMTWKQWNDPSDPGWSFEAKAQKFNYTQPPWSVKYPHLASIMSEEPRQPRYDPVRCNVFVDCGKQVCDFDAGVRKLLGKFDITNNLAVNTRGLKTAVVEPVYGGFTVLSGSAEKPVELGLTDLRKGDPKLVEGPIAFKVLPTFEPIPVDKIGLVKDEYRRELPTR